jgi:putative peptide zinc metalloprotease protein
MAEAVLSPHWYKVADLRPRLKPYVRVRRRSYRGQPWYVLNDPVAGRFHLVDAAAYQVVGRLDGSRTVQQIWESICATDPAGAPTQGETIDVLARLGRAELVQSGAVPDLQQQYRDRRRDAIRRRFAGLNPLSFRLPLGNPSAWLSRLAPRVAPLFHPVVGVLWALLVVAGAVTAASHFAELRAAVAQHALSARFLLLAWLCYPVMKLLHELAHAFAVHHWRGEVRQVGISLLVLVPVPYVDASAASGFGSRARRIAVSAAGIAVEAGLAAAAVFVWLAVEPGLVRDIALTVATIGGVSTLLVNANPLLRFDGYHVLTDAASLPNLAARSAEHWACLLRRRLLRVPTAQSPGITAGERLWLTAYAPLSLAYQYWLSATVLLWLAEDAPTLAAVCGAFLFVLLFGRPAWRAVRYLRGSAEIAAHRGRALAVAAGAALGTIALVALLPLPLSTTAQGVVWLPERASVRAATEGFLERVHATDGAAVAPGTLLVTLRNDVLAAELAQAEAELADAQAEYWRAVEASAADTRRFAADVARRESDAGRLRARVARLQLRAGVAGRFVLPQAGDRAQTWVDKGELLGHVVGREAAGVRVAVPQDRAWLVRERTRAVSVRTMDAPGRALAARIAGEVPQAGYDVPSAALTTLGGGALVADAADERGLRTRDPVALCEVIAPALGADRLGGRVLVRFDHGLEPLGAQLARSLRQLLLRHVDAGGATAGPATVARAQP